MMWKKQNQTEILEILGEGLTSRVYKAIRKHSALNVQQVVALKVLHSQELIHSLKNEIELLLSVDSPNCVKMLGWEETSMGLALVLEFLDGISLEELCRQRSLKPAEVDEIVFQIQEGLKELHKKNIVHGDISLRNIFITNSGTVKIIDFGFSSREQKKFDYGTPSCMSPEAWAGTELEPGSDLYSLGLMRDLLLETSTSATADWRNWQARSEAVKNKNALLHETPSERTFLNLTSHPKVRSHVGQYVKEIQKWQKMHQPTIKLVPDFAPALAPQIKFKKLSSLLIALFASVSVSAVEPVSGTYRNDERYNLDVRSRFAVKTRLFKKTHSKDILYHDGYLPALVHSLPRGQYVLHWTSQEKSGMIQVHIDEHKKIVIDVPN